MMEFIRIACAVPAVRVGDTAENAEGICKYIAKADAQGADLLLFPELALTGYTCQDLFFQEALHRGVRAGLRKVTACSGEHPALTVVLGLPLGLGDKMLNAAAIIRGGRVWGVTAKTIIPNYNEFYEKRWFSSAAELTSPQYLTPAALGLEGLQRDSILLSRHLIAEIGAYRLGIEICEDMWTAVPPANLLALAGAEVIVNLSASNEIIGKRAYRRNLVQHQSAALTCIYAYCSAGATESTQDLIFSGQSLIGENGILLAESKAPIATDYLLIQDCDLGRIRADRRRNRGFQDCGTLYAPKPDILPVSAEDLRCDGAGYPLQKRPFVPRGKQDRMDRCLEIFRMQASGLKHRLETTGLKPVVGVSGGLDSTLALLVSAEAMRRLGRPASEVSGVVPFGTGERMRRSAVELMQALGITLREMDNPRADASCQNSQALMDYAAAAGGLAVSSADLSELALGWRDDGGDQAGMYAVNASIPKTLIRWMIEAISESPYFAAARPVLLDILDTPADPEPLPRDANEGATGQVRNWADVEALQDFFLYHMLRFGFTPTKIYTLACRAFRGDFTKDEIKRWLSIFYRRFFARQVKRNGMPDGVKVGSVGLSPRGDWRMPSDITGALWIREAEGL